MFILVHLFAIYRSLRLKQIGLFVFLLTCPLYAESWEQLDGCTLVETAYADGDSFHVKQDRQEYIFRLYYVDTPEHFQKGGFHQRTDAQAKYFNIYKKDLYRIAGEASAFTAEALEDRFTVWTCWQDAGGQSQQPRYFGIVLTADGDDLAKLLVEQGYARIYGAKPEDSPVQSVKRMQKDLKKAEERARKSKTGAWAYSKKSS